MLIITFQNDLSGDDFAANYDVVVRVNSRIVHRERIEGHNRTHGWRALVRRLSEGDTDRRVGQDDVRGTRIDGSTPPDPSREGIS